MLRSRCARKHCSAWCQPLPPCAAESWEVGGEDVWFPGSQRKVHRGMGINKQRGHVGYVSSYTNLDSKIYHDVQVYHGISTSSLTQTPKMGMSANCEDLFFSKHPGPPGDPMRKPVMIPTRGDEQVRHVEKETTCRPEVKKNWRLLLGSMAVRTVYWGWFGTSWAIKWLKRLYDMGWVKLGAEQ